VTALQCCAKYLNKSLSNCQCHWSVFVPRRWQVTGYADETSSSAVAEWPLDASCLSLASLYSTSTASCASDITGRGRSPPRPLFAVPNVTAYPSTASVPITVLLYNGPLLCGFSVPSKGLKRSCRCFARVSLSVDWTQHAVSVFLKVGVLISPDALYRLPENVYLQMPTGAPNFNFLAWLVSDIWKGSQNNKWELLISQDAPSRHIFTWSCSIATQFNSTGRRVELSVW